MTPDALFQMANTLALVGWGALAVSPFLPRFADRVAGLVIPLILSVGYAATVLVHWSSSEGGFGALGDVAALFSNPWMLLAGWVHYLAFDMLVGSRIAVAAREEGIAFLIVLPLLALTFLFGPAGYLAFVLVRTARRSALSAHSV